MAVLSHIIWSLDEVDVDAVVPGRMTEEDSEDGAKAGEVAAISKQ